MRKEKQARSSLASVLLGVAVFTVAAGAGLLAAPSQAGAATTSGYKCSGGWTCGPGTSDCCDSGTSGDTGDLCSSICTVIIH